VHDDKDPSYSLLMHHTSGYVVLLIGILTLLDRLTVRRYPALRIAAGIGWVGVGIFIIRADPEGWPLSGSFTASWRMPTSGEWLQHKVLSLIPMGLGLSAIWTAHRADSNPVWNYALAFLAILGAIGLLAHQHRKHPGMDVVNFQHRLFAITALFTAGSLTQEAWKGWNWRGKGYWQSQCGGVQGLTAL